MKPDRMQQALAGVAVLFVIMVTLIGGVILAFSDNPNAMSALRPATATATATTMPISPRVDTATPTRIPTATRLPTKPLTPTPLPTDTPQPTSTPRPTTAPVVSTAAATNTLPPSPTPTTGPPPTRHPGAGVCGNPSAQIVSPAPGTLLSGVVTFTGSADMGNFSFYKLEIREDGSNPNTFTTIVTKEQPVLNGTLAAWDTRGISNGQWWFRLMVVDRNGNFIEPCTILYRVTN